MLPSLLVRSHGCSLLTRSHGPSGVAQTARPAAAAEPEPDDEPLVPESRS